MPKNPDKKTGLPTTILLSDDERPDRAARFETALHVGGVSPRAAFRAFADAFILYVETNRRVPSIPYTLISADERPAAKKKA